RHLQPVLIEQRLLYRGALAGESERLDSLVAQPRHALDGAAQVLGQGLSQAVELQCDGNRRGVSAGGFVGHASISLAVGSEPSQGRSPMSHNDTLTAGSEPAGATWFSVRRSAVRCAIAVAASDADRLRSPSNVLPLAARSHGRDSCEHSTPVQYHLVDQVADGADVVRHDP